MYYDINVQIWDEDGIFCYSVIQELDEQGTTQVLIHGDTDDLGEAIRLTRQAVLEVLSVN